MAIDQRRYRFRTGPLVHLQPHQALPSKAFFRSEAGVRRWRWAMLEANRRLLLTAPMAVGMRRVSAAEPAQSLTAGGRRGEWAWEAARS